MPRFEPDHQVQQDSESAEQDQSSNMPRLTGRGAALNPTNRFESISLNVLPERVEELLVEYPDGRLLPTQVFRDNSRTVINEVDSPDLPFRWTINPYRGCEHGCIYCYARPDHEYLSMSLGVDFETKIFAKFDAPVLLRKELMNPKWKGEHIVLSGITDPYQPLERALRITRGLLETMVEFHQPVSLITKNKLILRDLDLFQEFNRFGGVHCAISLTTLDPHLAAKMEPRASSPRARLETIAALAKAGIPVSVMTAPIIPGINDHEIPALLKAASEAGAQTAGYVLLRLPYQIKDLFLEWLSRHFPERAAKVESLLRDTRNGMLYNSEHFSRHKGEGALAGQIGQTFAVFARKYKIDQPWERPMATPFRRPVTGGGQLNLFDTT
jgi:DNA repair photolyase